MKKFVDGIVLAAGLSSRMGARKLLMELQGSTILERAVRTALESGLRAITVVLGPNAEEFKSILASQSLDPRLRYAINLSPAEGMSSSLATGVAATSPGADGVMILLADQPLITSRVIDDLIEAFVRDAEKIVLPTIHGRRTTPVVFPVSLVPELMRITGDKGGRDVIKEYADRVTALEMSSYYDDSDVDTKDDLDTVRARLADKPGGACS